MKSICELSTELHGVGNTILALSLPYGEGGARLEDGGMCSALCAIADHIERIVDELDKLEE